MMASSLDEQQSPKDYKKRIFILTDGTVGNTQQIVDYCKNICGNNSDDIKVFTFGIGDGCSVDLCKRVAEAGRGEASIVSDGSEKELKAKVVDALRKASDPAL